jgi:hypothetical protein
LVGSEVEVARAYAALQDPLASIGLIVNPSKCQLWTQAAGSCSTALGVPIIVAGSSPNALSVLGLPAAGDEAALRRFVESAVTKTVGVTADIAKLQHAQGESIILRGCGPTSRLRHLLRFHLPASALTALQEADEATLQHVARILGRPPPPGWESMVAQNINNGGLGFELLTNLDSRTLSRQASDLVTSTIVEAAEDDRAHGLDPKWLLQHLEKARSWPLPAEPAASSAASSSMQVDDATWMREASARAPFASAFLHAAPGPGTTLSDAEFRDALWMRLGLPAADGHSACDPPARVDFRGEHRLGCKAAADARLRRHDAMASVIAKTALTADPRAFQVAREAHVPDSASPQSRPGDVALDLGDGRTYVDVTVVNAYSAAHLTASRSAGSPARAAELAFDRKTAKYAEQFAEDSGSSLRKFVPLAVTTLGVWDERSLRWLRRFSAVCAAASSIDSGQAFASLMTNLSLALWRGNSKMMRACRSSSSSLSESVEF